MNNTIINVTVLPISCLTFTSLQGRNSNIGRTSKPDQTKPSRQMSRFTYWCWLWHKPLQFTASRGAEVTFRSLALPVGVVGCFCCPSPRPSFSFRAGTVCNSAVHIIVNVSAKLGVKVGLLEKVTGILTSVVSYNA
jgi:hypothetical protein